MESLTVGLSLGRASPGPQGNQDYSQRQHRRAQSYDEGLSYQFPPRHSSLSMSWLPSARRQRSMSPAVIRSGDDSYRTLSPLPPVKPGVSKFSSARLLHSRKNSSDDAVGKPCVEAGSVARTRWSELPVAERNRPRPTRNSQHIASLYEQNTNRNGEPSERSFSPFSDSAVTMMPDGHLERLAVTPSLGQHDAWTDSVQLLIKETADAFQAVQSTLEDASLTSWLLDLPEAPGTTRPSETPIYFVPPHATLYQKEEPIDQPMTPKSINTSIDKPLPPCPEKQRMKRAKVEEKKTSQSKVLRQAKSARWTVSNGVAQILSGTRFKRVQADEMLTSEKIEEMRVNRLKKDKDDQGRSSTEGRDSFESSTSTLSQQSNKSAGTASTIASKEVKPSVLPLEDAVTHKDFSLSKTSTRNSVSLQEQNNGDASASTTNVGSLNPPPKNPQRYVFTKSKARLPTIHEVVAAQFDESEESVGRPSEDHSLRSQDSDEFIYLPGTPLSAVNSSFRHGRIACQIADAYTNSDEEMDDAIDSAAYQMAIQGISGDLRTALYEDDENKLADDMAEWFSTFGFETHGQLIPDGASSPWSLSSRSITSTSPSTINSEVDGPPIPMNSEDNYTFSEPIRFFRSSMKPRKWTPSETAPKQYNLRNTQGHSFGLKSNPLVVEDNENGCMSTESADLIFSMKADVGDFLTWRAARGE